MSALSLSGLKDFCATMVYSLCRFFSLLGHGLFQQKSMWSCSSMLSSSFRDGRRAAELAAIGFIKREVNMVGFRTVDFAKGSPDAILLDKACLILWDEAPMVRYHYFEALDRIFRDILAVYDSSRSLFPLRGKVVVLSGDFKQVLPVMQEGAKTGIIGASLVMSTLWRHIKVLKLHINMCLAPVAIGASLESREELAEFA